MKPFVANEHDDHVRAGMLACIIQPSGEVIERVSSMYHTRHAQFTFQAQSPLLFNSAHIIMCDSSVCKTHYIKIWWRLLFSRRRPSTNRIYRHAYF